MAKKNTAGRNAFNESRTYGNLIAACREAFDLHQDISRVNNFIDEHWQRDWERDEVDYDDENHLDSQGVFYWVGRDSRYPTKLKLAGGEFIIPASENYPEFHGFFETYCNESGTQFLTLRPSTKVRDKVVPDMDKEAQIIACNNALPRASKPVASTDSEGSIRFIRFVNSGWDWFKGKSREAWFQDAQVEPVLKNLAGWEHEIRNPKPVR